MYDGIIRRSIWFFRIVITIIIIFECVVKESSTTLMQLALICGMVLIITNDIVRGYYLKHTIRLFSLSIALSITGAGLYALLLNSLPATVFFLFPLIELFIYREKLSYSLLVLHAGIFVYANYLLKDLTVSNLATYISIVFVLYFYKINLIERQKTTELNQELIAANNKLLEYANKSKQIAALNERTRIAQELHDSIGHGLIALSMNLEFIEKTAKIDGERVTAIARKAHEQSLMCIQNLRNAVNVLKSEKTNNEHLKSSITELIKFSDQSYTAILLSFDDRAEKISIDAKDCIYKAIREAITNSLKNGKADNIKIDVSISNEKLVLVIKDNGIGCNNIKKSYGLLGIEERTKRLGGCVQYESEQGCGFLITIYIPVGKGVLND